MAFPFFSILEIYVPPAPPRVDGQELRSLRGCCCLFLCQVFRPLGNMGGVKKHRGFGCGLFVEPRGI